MAPKLCYGGAFTRNCPSGLKTSALATTLLLLGIDCHKGHGCGFQESLSNVNDWRHELILAPILEEDWHYDQWNFASLLNIGTRILIFASTWKGMSSRWFGGGWACWALQKPFIDMESEDH
jgi:hypothetical protein